MDLYESYPSSSLLDNDDYQNLLLAFEKRSITTTDLVVYEPKEIAQRCSRSVNEINRFLEIFFAEALHGLDVVTVGELPGQHNTVSQNCSAQARTGSQLKTSQSSQITSKTLNSPHTPEKGPSSSSPRELLVLPSPHQVSTPMLTTGDKEFDRLLNGGIPVGYITEVSGESSAGKSNLLIQLSLTVQLPKLLGGLEKSALYISTEAGFETRRVIAMLEYFKQTYPSASQITTDNIHCYTCRNQDELEHILKYQVPIAVEQYNIGTVIIDSIAAHLRAEYEHHLIFKRTKSLLSISQNLRKLAYKHQLAIVTANQVSDRFTRQLRIHAEPNPLFFDHQVRWFSGWDEPSIVVPPGLYRGPSPSISASPSDTPKIPSLGLVWSNCIDIRIVLKRRSDRDGTSKRTFHIVFSPFCPPSSSYFEITQDGIYSTIN